LTTVLVPVQAEVEALLGIPDGYLIAAHLTVGWPAQKLPTHLDRNPVGDFATVDRFAGPPVRRRLHSESSPPSQGPAR
jgi:hypothetical protein